MDPRGRGPRQGNGMWGQEHPAPQRGSRGKGKRLLSLGPSALSGERHADLAAPVGSQLRERTPGQSTSPYRPSPPPATTTPRSPRPRPAERVAALATSSSGSGGGEGGEEKDREFRAHALTELGLRKLQFPACSGSPSKRVPGGAAGGT